MWKLLLVCRIRFGGRIAATTCRLHSASGSIRASTLALAQIVAVEGQDAAIGGVSLTSRRTHGIAPARRPGRRRT
jgi:hypothetical protein